MQYRKVFAYYLWTLNCSTTQLTHCHQFKLNLSWDAWEWCYIKKTEKKTGTNKLGRIGNEWESNKISVLKITVYIAARETFIHQSFWKMKWSLAQ